MNIISYERDRIEEGLSRARRRHGDVNEDIRLLFAPTRINHDNFDRACDIYSRIDPGHYDSVVIVESYQKELDKKLSMPSDRYFETPLGRVPVNDFLRNKLCDEDDHFFIHNKGYSLDMSLYQQLMMLQCVIGDFKVLSIQIADSRPEIVRQLGIVLEEVLVSMNALLVFCCELDNAREKKFRKVKRMVTESDHAGLLKYLNSGESRIRGAASFYAGILVAGRWDLNLNFLNGEYQDYRGSLLTAYGDRQAILQ